MAAFAESRTTVEIECGCGRILSAEDHEGLRVEAERHVGSSHPELVATLSPLELAGPPGSDPRGPGLACLRPYTV